MYMCHFSQILVRLPFDNFTIEVLHLLNIAPIQLHPNSWGIYRPSGCCADHSIYICLLNASSISMTLLQKIRLRGYLSSVGLE